MLKNQLVPISQSPDPEANRRRTFWLGVGNGTFFQLTLSLIHPSKVLAAFALRLTGSNVVVGLLLTVMQAGFLWPQLFISHLVYSRPRKMPFYWLSMGVRLVAWGAVLACFLAFRDQPRRLFWSFLLCYAVYCSGGGMSMVPFMDLIGRYIPAEQRGRFWGYRRFLGGVLSFGAGFFVQHILSEHSGWAFPMDFFLLFATAYLTLMTSMLFFSVVREEPQPVERPPDSFRAFLRNGPRIWRENPDFRRLFGWRAAMRVSLMAMAFFVPYALQDLQADESITGVFVSGGVLSAALSNFFWSRQSDERGNRRLLLLGSGLWTLVPLIALSTSLIPDGNSSLTLPGFASPLSIPLLFYLSVFLLGDAAIGGVMMGDMNYLLEISNDSERPLYLGFMNTFTGPLLLSPLLGGWLSQFIGIRGLFGLSVGFGILAFSLAWSLREPRQHFKGR